MKARIAEVSGDLIGPDPRDFVRQGPPTGASHTYLGRPRVGGRGLFVRPGRWRHRLFLWSSGCVAAAVLGVILAAFFGHTVVVIVICAVVALVIGSFGHTEADLRFRPAPPSPRSTWPMWPRPTWFTASPATRGEGT